MPRFWIELLGALGYGILASVAPVLNGEAFIVATQATGLIDPYSLGVGLGVGQGLGKMILFQLVRQGKKIPWAKTSIKTRRSTESRTTRWRKRLDSFISVLVSLVENRRWSPLILFTSGALSLPPNYITTLFAATTKISFPLFSFWLTSGFVVRAITESLILAGILNIWFS